LGHPANKLFSNILGPIIGVNLFLKKPESCVANQMFSVVN
jgi:hypothetical protein